MTDYTTRAWLEINLDNLKHNYNTIQNSLAPGSRIMAIVKADGYGMGDIQAANFFKGLGCDWFGVSNFAEVKALRENGIDCDILQMGYTHPKDIVAMAKRKATQGVVGFAYAKEINEVLQQSGETLKVHIKLDTGMSRIGIQADRAETVQEITEIFHLSNLEVTGIFTHCSVADEGSEESLEFTQMQFRRFENTIKAVEEKGYKFMYKHCCNSAATINYPERHYDLVRPGAIMYGLALTDDTTKGKLPLKPVTTLKARISLVKEVHSGDTISYGRVFKAKKAMKVATVTLGYADGYSRNITGRGYGSINGQRVDVIGRICMDQIMVDVSEIPQVKEGDIVTLIGSDGAAPTTAQYAELFGSIDTEAITILGKRLPRLYFSENVLQDVRVYV